MALFKAKDPQQQQQQPVFDAQAFEQRLMNQVGQAISSALGPVVSAIQILSQQRQEQPQVDEEGNELEQRQPPAQPHLTPAQIRQMAREEAQAHAGSSKDFVPRSQVKALNLFRRELTDQGRTLFDRYQDEIDSVMSQLAPELQNSPEAYKECFEYAMFKNHRNEYIAILNEDMKPEDIPPHLQSPGGMGGATEGNEPELTDDEKEVMGLFNSSKHSAKRFTPQEMKDYRDINPNFRLTMDQIVEQAREKGLIKNGTAPANQGNNA